MSSSKHSAEGNGAHAHTLSFDERSGEWCLKNHNDSETDASMPDTYAPDGDTFFPGKEHPDSARASEKGRLGGEEEEGGHSSTEGQPPALDVDQETGLEHVNKLALTTLTLGLCIAVFLLSLDRTIVTTAIPTITDEFHSYPDVGWYGSAYFLTSFAFQPLFGRIYQMAPIKLTYLLSLVTFGVGSIVCALAPQSMALIIGRAVSGFASAGLLSGSFVVVAHSAPLHARPAYTGIVGVFYSLGAVAGPLIGGLLTSLASDIRWRWCFWINLPIGAVGFVAVMLLFKPKQKLDFQGRPLREKLAHLDLLGNILLLAASVMFFLALQYNNSGIPWGDSRVIGLLAGAGAGGLLFAGWQFWRGDRALIPPRIALQRSVAFSFAAAFFIYGALLTQNYFLPIWFQAIKGRSAVLSGVDMIPYLLSAALGSLFAGILVSILGYFTPASILGSAIGLVGSGLLCTLDVGTTPGNWIGYSILAGGGLGLAVQQGFNAVQTVLSLEDIPIGTAGITFFQSMGGAVWVSVGNTLIINDLERANLPGIDAGAVVAAGATMFSRVIPHDLLPAFLDVYNSALRRALIAAAVISGCALLVSCGIEWKSVRKRPDQSTTKPESASSSDK